ncbi:hypothetical protein BH11BAC2_BH11BAC2_19650 [soil metagenome]
MTIQRAIKLFLILIITISISSCNLINPEEKIPAYFEVNKILVSSDYLTQGTSANGVENVWVYADGQYIGTYQLPARFPILLSGVHKIQLGAGILVNGIDATREAYTLYKFYETDVDLKAGETTVFDTINVSYFPALKYSWFEDIEGSGVSLDTLPASKVPLEIDTTQAFEGKGCLKFYVHDSLDVLECSSNEAYKLPLGTDCFLELNYKCDHVFYVGLISNFSTYTLKNPIIRINPSETWKKIYIKLNATLSANGTAIDHNVWFREDLGTGGTSGTVYLDNIKLIHR